MLKTILIIIAVLLGGLLIYAATKPDTFAVSRSIDIKAPPEEIYAFINDFRRWSAWSPYEKLDPEMKRTYSGPDTGKGSIYEWAGNSNAGEGRIEIADAAPPSKLVLNLDFVKPMKAHNVVEFTLMPQGESTRVTWAMHGDQNYLGKVMHVIFNMDKMVGKDFETGLASLKTAAES